jgi:acetyl-CoA acetyltransferase
LALVACGSTHASDASRRFGGAPEDPRLPGSQFERRFGLPLPLGAYALAATRHMALYGTTSEQLGEIAVATRRWAQLNPVAMMRDPITIQDVLDSRLIVSGTAILGRL